MSNALPSNLALSTINTDDPVASAPLRNNFAATQTGVNQVISCLSGGSLGQVLEAVDNSDVQWAYPPGYEIGYDSITAQANITGLTLGNATTAIAGSAHTFDGGSVVAEFYASAVELPGVADGTMNIVLFEGGTPIATLASLSNPAAANCWMGGCFRYRFTPSAGSHTYSIKAYVSSTAGTPNIFAGAGTAGANAPAYLRFTKV